VPLPLPSKADEHEPHRWPKPMPTLLFITAFLAGVTFRMGFRHLLNSEIIESGVTFSISVVCVAIAAGLWAVMTFCRTKF
jgi:hypothetical protein